MACKRITARVCLLIFFFFFLFYCKKGKIIRNERRRWMLITNIFRNIFGIFLYVSWPLEKPYGRIFGGTMLQGKTSLFDGRYNRLDSALFCTILFLCLFRISNYAICHFICHNYAKWVISWQRCSVAAMQWKRDADLFTWKLSAE